MRIRQTSSTVLVLSSLIFCHSLMAQGFLPLPENSAIVSAVAGEGVQIYESKPNPSGGFQWSLKAPEADLKGLSGEILGKHGAGPSWTMDDGSSIVGNLPPLETVVVALYLNRRLWPFTALNSWTGGLATGLNSWTNCT
jgi:hypothetical protein